MPYVSSFLVKKQFLVLKYEQGMFPMCKPRILNIIIYKVQYRI